MKHIAPTPESLTFLLNKVWSLDNQLVLLLRQGHLTLYEFTHPDELNKLFQGLRITKALDLEGTAVYGLARYTNLVGISFIGKNYRYIYPEANNKTDYSPVLKGVGEEYMRVIIESAELVKAHPYIYEECYAKSKEYEAKRGSAESS